MSVELITVPLIWMLVPAVYLVSVALITFALLICTFVPAVYLVSVALITLFASIAMFEPAVNLSCLVANCAVVATGMSVGVPSV